MRHATNAVVDSIRIAPIASPGRIDSWTAAKSVLAAPVSMRVGTLSATRATSNATPALGAVRPIVPLATPPTNAQSQRASASAKTGTTMLGQPCVQVC
jgi:hypothetical protein